MHNTEKGPGRETRAFLLALIDETLSDEIRPERLADNNFAEIRTVRPGQPERIVV